MPRCGSSTTATCRCRSCPARSGRRSARWSTVPIDAARRSSAGRRQFPGHGIGLRTGALVGVDIDVLDPDLAHSIERAGAVAARRHADPGRALAEAAAALPDRRRRSRRCAAGGRRDPRPRPAVRRLRHPPDTGQPYHWPLGDTPLDVPLDALPLRRRRRAARACSARSPALLPRAAARRAAERRRRPPGGRATATGGAGRTGPQRDASGRVVDGRDGWLSTIAYHAVHDALAAGAPLDAARARRDASGSGSPPPPISTRPAAHGARYALADAERKVADKLRLLADGRLPPRDEPAVEADYQAPTLAGGRGAGDGSTRCSRTACDRIEAWHAAPESPPPRIGIRATVGLGKSASARRQLLALRARLIAAGAPSRLLVLHAVARARRGGGGRLARRGRHASRCCAATRRVDPRTRTPMCRDVAAVRAAIDARLERARDRLRRRRAPLRLLRRLPEAAQPRRGRRRRRRRRRPRGALHRLRGRGRRRSPRS